MEKEKKEISRKTLIGIIIALVVTIIIAFGVIIFFIGNNNKQVENLTQPATSENKNDIDKISNMLSSLKEQYGLDFEPTEEQMNEMIAFYKSTNDFNEESLFDFIGQKGWTVRGNGEIDDSQEQSTNFSDTDLEEFIKQDFKDSTDEYYDTLDKIEKYDEDGNGKYIYILRYHGIVTVNGGSRTQNYINVYGLDTTKSTSEPKVEKVSVGDSYSLESTIAQIKSKINWNTSGSSNSSNNSSLNYKSDLELIILALKKWFEQDSYVEYQFNNTIPSVYDGKVTKNNDGSVSVALVLYVKDTYEQAIKYNVSVEGTKWASKIIKLTKVEATK